MYITVALLTNLNYANQLNTNELHLGSYKHYLIYFTFPNIAVICLKLILSVSPFYS